MLISSLGQESVADKPCTSRCPSVSVADITDCATSPAEYPLLVFFFLLNFCVTHDHHGADRRVQLQLFLLKMSQLLLLKLS